MTPENFCYWLQGFFELQEKETGLSAAQIKLIKEHLKLAFDKKTSTLDDLLRDFPLRPSGPGFDPIITCKDHVGFVEADPIQDSQTTIC